jgi:hypothetical protein
LSNYKIYNTGDRKYYKNISLRGRRLPSGFIERSTRKGLKKSWTGYKIARAKGDYDKMIYYAEGIRKFQRQLDAPLSDFPELSLAVKENQENVKTSLELP